jgi:hypothetical protein
MNMFDLPIPEKVVLLNGKLLSMSLSGEWIDAQADIVITMDTCILCEIVPSPYRFQHENPWGKIVERMEKFRGSEIGVKFTNLGGALQDGILLSCSIIKAESQLEKFWENRYYPEPAGAEVPNSGKEIACYVTTKIELVADKFVVCNS